MIDFLIGAALALAGAAIAGSLFSLLIWLLRDRDGHLLSRRNTWKG